MANDPVPPSDDELAVAEDLDHQEREWRRERVTWVVMALVVVAAVGGAFGHGLFSTRTVSERAGFAVTYERVARQGGPTDLIASIDLPADDVVALRVSGRYLADMNVEAITPEPARSLATNGGVVYEFELHPSPGDGAVQIRFDLRPDDLGSTAGDIELVGHSTVHIEQFLLP